MTTSMSQRWVRTPLKAVGRPVTRRVNDAQDRRRGIPVPPWSLRSQVPGDFRKAGRQFSGHLVDLGGLSPHDRVLDIGCRVGRLGIPLTGYLAADAHYEGVDDWPDGTAWCQATITSRYPQFGFRQIDMEGPGGSAAPPPLPYADGSFDFVIFGSILQLSPGGFDHFVREAARVTRPGGTYFGTWYLRNESRPPGAGQVGPAITCREAEARQRLESVGLGVVAVHRGSWDGHERPLSHQDVVIARRKSDG